MKTSVRIKLTISFLGVISICGVISTLVGMHLISSGVIGQAQDKVRIDLNSARHIYRDEIQKVKTLVSLTVQRFFIKNALLERDVETLQRELEEIRRRDSLDVLNLLNKNGQVIVMPRNPGVYGDSQSDDKLVNLVLLRKEVAVATVIVPKEEIIKEGQDLAEQAYI